MYTLNGDLIKDNFNFFNDLDPVRLNFLEITSSYPEFNIPEADGYLGLLSKN
jgi:hypothetical protein